VLAGSQSVFKAFEIYAISFNSCVYVFILQSLLDNTSCSMAAQQNGVGLAIERWQIQILVGYCCAITVGKLFKPGPLSV